MRGGCYMKIHYKQTSDKDKYSPFDALGITDCYFKELHIKTDTAKIVRKAHHHDGFEIHIIIRGHQEYLFDDKVYSINDGEFLLVPPFVRHRPINSEADTEKFSLTFSTNQLDYLTECVTGKIPQRFFENAEFIINERRTDKFFSSLTVQNSVFESVLSFLRICGLRETSDKQRISGDNLMLESAKQYIENNVENWLSVSDIAAYCYISTRQVTRMFLKNEHMPPAQYICGRRIAYIKRLLEDNELSLKAISEKMNFNDECYFNAFVKKHLGMPPGTYRKMNKQD